MRFRVGPAHIANTRMLAADFNGLTACHLDDYSAAWAQRFMVPSAMLARREGEPDAGYRPRLVALIAELRSRRPSA